MRDVYLRAVGAHVPDRLASNDDICSFFGFSKARGERYKSVLGVRHRPVCVDYRTDGRQVVTAEELARRAAMDALKKADLGPRDIDAIVSCAATVDYLMPSISSRLLKLLDIPRCITFDLIGGCAEFLHGVQVAANMIRLGQAENVLVTSSEVLNAWWRQVRYPVELFIFGDTGGAFVLSSKKGGHRVSEVFLQTASHLDGNPAELICLPILGGKAHVPLFYANETTGDNLGDKTADIPAAYRMIHDGKAVAIGAPALMIEATQEVIRRQNLDPTKVFLVPHQASIGVLTALPASGVPLDQIGISLPERGNMSTSSIPVTLSENWDRAGRHRHIVLASVGVGVSYGAIVLEEVAAR